MPARILVALTAVLLLGALRLDAAGARALNKTATPAAKGCNAPAGRCCIELRFDRDHLPSAYGWTYENLGTGSNQGAAAMFTIDGGWNEKCPPPPNEKCVFSLKNGTDTTSTKAMTHLFQATVANGEVPGGESYGARAGYFMPGVVSTTAPFTLTARVKVTNHKQRADWVSPGATCGFDFGARLPFGGEDHVQNYDVCITESAAQLNPRERPGQTIPPKFVPLDPSKDGFHTYQLEVIPGVGAALLIDGEFKDWSAALPEALPKNLLEHKLWPTELNRVWIGKETGSANADAEIASFSYCSWTCEPAAAKRR
jgi:hypothetical protein